MKTLCIKDDSFAHCTYSNNPMPPKTFSRYITWDRTNTIEGQTIYTDYYIQRGMGNKETVWLLEPYDLQSHAYEHVKRNIANYKEVWTHEKTLLDLKEPHVKFVPFGGCWIDETDRKVHTKNKMFSIIASNKKQLQGHQLRHNIILASGPHIDVFGNGYKPVKDKIEGLKDYRYHFAIENCKRDYWFTEKLIDCLATGTIPIYWGCPSIGDFFNTDGFIIFDNLYDLKEKLQDCTLENYNTKLPIIKENFELAKKYYLAEDWMYENSIIK